MKLSTDGSRINVCINELYISLNVPQTRVQIVQTQSNINNCPYSSQSLKHNIQVVPLEILEMGEIIRICGERVKLLEYLEMGMEGLLSSTLLRLLYRSIYFLNHCCASVNYFSFIILSISVPTHI